MRRILIASALCLPLFFPDRRIHAAPPEEPPAVLAQTKQRPRPAAVLQTLLGIPYREDGVRNDHQQYATFNAPDTVCASPGLNCSGLALEASRRVLERNIPVKEAARDRLGDSGPDSPSGRDWDFGFDLIMNIAEGTRHEILLPEGAAMPEELTGKTVPAFSPHAPAFADDLLPRITEDRLYLVSFSKHKTPDAPAHLHYHTGILVREGAAVWYYGATHGSRRVIRLNLASPEGLAAFRRGFRNTGASHKRLTVIEIVPE